MANVTHSINLLPNKGGSLTNQFLSWALTIGRLLIILTETLALSVFLYRFSIDMRIIDLNDLIKNQSAIVAQFKTVEDTSRNLHERLALINKIEKDANRSTSLFSDIVEMGRGKITFKNILVSDSLMKIELQAPSTASINTFINALKIHPEIKSVSIDTVENRLSSATIVMSITADLESLGDEPQGDELINTVPIQPINP